MTRPTDQSIDHDWIPADAPPTDWRSRVRAGWEGLLSVAGLLGTVILAGLMWGALAVLILPLPAATAALCYTVGRAAAGETGNPFADFLGGLRRHWRRASAVGGPALFLGVMLGVDALFFLQQPSMMVKGAGWLFASGFLLWAAVMLMFWPALVFRDTTWQRLVKESFWLTMVVLPRSLLATLAAALLVIGAFASTLFIPFTPGLIALIASWNALRTFRHVGLAIHSDS